jgi:hypothetical protein
MFRFVSKAEFVSIGKPEKIFSGSEFDLIY